MNAALTDEVWAKIEAAVSKSVGEAFTNARRDSDLHKLGVTMTLLAMLQTDKFGKAANKTLEEYDAEARGVLAMRRVLVEQERDRLSALPSVRDALLRARQLGVHTALGSHHRARIQAFADYLTSEQFYATLDGLPVARRGERLKLQAVRIASLDPEAAQLVSAHWMAHELARNPLEVIRGVSEQEAVRALEDLLAFFAKLSEDQKSMKHAQGSSGPKGATLIPAAAIHELICRPQLRRVMARGLTRAMRARSYHSSLGMNDTRLIAKLKADNVPGAALLERLASFSAGGRFVTTVFSLWGLAAITECFPPVDNNGNVRWSQIAMSGSAALSITSNIPDMVKFFSTDVGSRLARFVSAEVRATVATTACSIGSKVRYAKFVSACKFLGPLGDAIALPFAINAAAAECKNEDSVGEVTAMIGFCSAYAGLTGGLLMLGSTGVGLPIAVVAAGIGIAAALIEAQFGESGLTGQIRQDLRYVGISYAEEQTQRDLTTEVVTVRRSTGLFGLGGKRNFSERHSISASRVRSRVNAANRYQKIQLINQALDGNTSSAEEKMVWEVFLDTPYRNGEFLGLIEAVDARRVATELEDASEAAILMVWTAKAYHAAGKPVGRAFNEQFLQLCREHRDATINAFLDAVLENSATGNTLPRDIYYQISPGILKQGTQALMSGCTDSGEERAIYRILATTNYKQFNAILEDGDLAYLRRLESEISNAQWRKFYGWMRHDGASPRVQTYAKIVGR